MIVGPLAVDKPAHAVELIHHQWMVIHWRGCIKPTAIHWIDQWVPHGPLPQAPSALTLDGLTKRGSSLPIHPNQYPSPLRSPGLTRLRGSGCALRIPVAVNTDIVNENHGRRSRCSSSPPSGSAPPSTLPCPPLSRIFGTACGTALGCISSCICSH